MKILFINNDGQGFADYLDLADGTTVQQLFALKMGQLKPEQFLIRVNRRPAAREQVLVEGDRCTFTPVKVEGANC